MITIQGEITEQADGKMQTVLYASREESTTAREQILVNELVKLIAGYISVNSGAGTTMVHRKLPPLMGSAAPDLNQPGNCPCCHKPHSAHVGGRCPFGL